MGTIRAALALALMLWFAGAGCVFVSYVHAATSDAGESPGDGSCPAHQSSGNASHHAAGGDVKEAISIAADDTVIAGPPACHKTQSPFQQTGFAKSGPGVQPLSSQLNRTPPLPGAMTCCPLMNVAAAIATRPRVNDSAGAEIVEQIVLPDPVGRAATSPLTTPLRLPNRGHTYLRCCVFLI